MRSALAALLLALCAPPGVAPAADAGLGEALRAALDARDLAEVRALVARGADPNLRLAHGRTPLMTAAREGDAETVAALIDAGADVDATNDNGGTALMFAAIPGDIDAVRVLVERGADVGAVGHFRWTAMMVAAAKGHADVVRLLAASGADPGVADIYGWTPLMRAAWTGRRPVVEAFLELDAVDVEARDDRGATALHLAAEKGSREIVDLLLAHGADAGSTDRIGRTPAMVASAKGHAAIAEMIEARAR